MRLGIQRGREARGEGLDDEARSDLEVVMWRRGHVDGLCVVRYRLYLLYVLRQSSLEGWHRNSAL
jgi:hypothetical protein